MTKNKEKSAFFRLKFVYYNAYLILYLTACFIGHLILSSKLLHFLSKVTFEVSLLASLSLIDEAVGLRDLGAEDIVLHKETSDLVDWELDEHTSDLWSSVLWDKLLDEWEDHLSDLFLEMLVSFGTGWKQLGGLLLILGNSRVHLHLLVSLHWDALWDSWWSWHCLLGHWHWWALHGWWHWLSAHGSLWHWWSLGWHTTGSHAGAALSVVVVWSSVATLVSTAAHVSLVVAEGSGHLLVLLHDVKELLEDLGDVWVGGQVVELHGAGLGGLVLLEIGLVDLILNLDFSEFFDLVVVDDEGLAFIDGVAEGLLSVGSMVWRLEADEGEVAGSLSLLELDLLDLTEVLEEVVKLGLTPAGWEVLDVEVASLLGGLVSEGLLLLLSLSLDFLESVSDVELEGVAGGIGTHLFALKAFEGLLGASWSVLDVSAIWIIIADETVLSDLVLAEDEGFDVSVLGEQLGDIGIGHRGWDVLDIDVVDESSHVSSVLWLELDGNAFGTGASGGDGLGGGVIALEADESIASGGVVLVEGDLQTLDGTVLLESVVELLVSNGGWDGSDENVLLGELLSVGTEELSVELEASALLAVDLEVLHLLAGFLELSVIWDGDDGSPEWAGDVLSDLGSALEVNASAALELHGDLLGIDGVLGEVVEVDKVLFISVLHHFCGFSFLYGVKEVVLFFVKGYMKSVFWSNLKNLIINLGKIWP